MLRRARRESARTGRRCLPRWTGWAATNWAVRVENSRRILAEHGVTCFVNRDGGGTDEPWQLDLLPLVLGGEEWRAWRRG